MEFIEGIWSYIAFGGILVALPFVFMKMRRQATPAKLSDLWGYLFIALFCTSIAAIFWKLAE